MVNNLQIEVKRHKLNQQFLEQIEFGNHSPQVPMDPKQYENEVLQPVGNNNPETKPPITVGSSEIVSKSIIGSRLGARDKSQDTLRGQEEPLEMIDTEHQELKKVIKKNGQEYSVRTNRKRFFYPNEWNNFLKELVTPGQRLSFDILINTGCRYNEGFNIRKRDIDFERGTLTLKVTKIKAKKGQKFPEPRTFRLSSQFLSRLKDYTKDKNDDEKIGMLSAPALNIAMKKALIKAGIEDFYMFSLHNVRKTHGNWLNAHKFTIVDICKRLGHDYNTFLGSYASADIFRDEDRVEIKEILGDLIK